MKAQPVLWIALAVAGFTARAVAQPTSDEATRRDLVVQALRASAQGNHPLALDLAARAGRIRMTTALRMLLAQEHNALGHTLDAFDFAVRCVREAESDPAMADRTRVLEGCNALVASLRERVGRLALRMPEPTPAGLRIRVQGSEVSPSNLGVPYAVLPGIVAVEATAGPSAFRREVTVAGGETREVVIVLAPIESPAPVVAVRAEVPRVVTNAEPTRRGFGAGPWVVAGVGVASFAAAAVFYGLRQSALAERDAACGAAICPAGVESQDRAHTMNTLTNVSLAVGGAAVAGAAVWFILARPRAERNSRAATVWFMAPLGGNLGAGIEGRF